VTDRARARLIGRPAVQNSYPGLVNNTNNLRSLGFTDMDLTGGGSDRLLDALIVYGELDAVVAGLTAHLDAVADHVPINPLTALDEDPLPGFATLAQALFR
jgi:hypothetical protein